MIMEKTEFIKKTLEAFRSNGLGSVIDQGKAEKLYEFTEILIETNKSFNLTAITDENDVILKHFVDCATVVKYIPTNANLLDVGCGAGFPSMPIAILRGDVTVHSLDSTGKKIDFINATAEKMGLGNISAFCARAEDYVKTNREKYDIVTSRAVARLNILDEICLPLVKVGGDFIAMKSNKGYEELSEASKGIETLGGQLKSHLEIELEYADNKINREIIIFSKVKSTPKQYPRNYSQISKKPL